MHGGCQPLCSPIADDRAELSMDRELADAVTQTVALLIGAYEVRGTGLRSGHTVLPLSLLPQNLLDLTDLFLKFAGYLFIGTFGFQLRIIAEFPGDLLTLPFTS